MKKSLNIAIGLFGHARTFKETSLSFNRNLIENNNVDLYIHSWRTVESETQSWWKNKGGDNKGEFSQEIAEKYYQARKKIIEDQDELAFLKTTKEKKISFGNSCIPMEAIRSMLYSLSSCVRMIRESGINYDLVIMLRPDVLVKEKVNYIDLYNILNADRELIVSFPLNSHVKIIDKRIIQKYGAMDIFFAGKQKTIEKLFLEPDNLYSYYLKSSRINPNLPYPEVVFSNYLKDNMVEIILYVIDYVVPRTNGDLVFSDWVARDTPERKGIQNIVATLYSKFKKNNNKLN